MEINDIDGIIVGVGVGVYENGGYITLHIPGPSSSDTGAFNWCNYVIQLV